MKIKAREQWLLPKNMKNNWSGQFEILEVENRKTKAGEDWAVLKVCDVDDNEEYYVSAWALHSKQELEIQKGTVLELGKKDSLDSRFICNVYQPAKVVKL